MRCMAKLSLTIGLLGILPPARSDCTIVQTRSGGAGAYSFDQFDPAIGTLTGVSIEFATTVSARMDGRNDCTSCVNFKAILCGLLITDWPGIVDHRDNILLCNPFFASAGQVVNVSLGGTPPLGGTFSVSSSSWHLYTGTGQVTVTSGTSFGDWVPCNTGGPCPTPPPPGFPPCQDFGNQPCFSRAFTITVSTVIVLTYTYQTALEITNQPVDDATCLGGDAGFGVFGAGAGFIGYQWQLEAVPGSNVWTDLIDGPIPGSAATAAGAMSEALAIGGADAAAARRYRCLLSNACQSVASNSASLAVCDEPADINCDGAVDLADLGGLLASYGQTGGATREDGDVDGDSDVDLTDLALLLHAFGALCS